MVMTLDEELDNVAEPREEEIEAGLLAIAESPSKFCTALLGFTPFPYQTELLEDPSKNIVVCAARQVGKSKIIGAKALWFAFTHENTSTYIVAATQRQSMMMFDGILSYLDQSDLIVESVVRKTRTQLHFTNGSKIVALPCGRRGRTLRGATSHMIIVDEAAFVPEEVILEVLLPMLATTNGTIILMSTPLDRSHFFYQAYNSPLWSRYHFKTEDNPLVTRDFLERQLEFLGERRFAQEHLAEFVDEEDTYFPVKLLRSCVHVCDCSEGCTYCGINSGKIKPTGNLYAGFDPGGLVDPAALVVVQKNSGPANNKKAFRVVLKKTFYVAKKNRENGKLPDEIYTKFTVQVSDYHKELHFQALIVDSTGIGRPIVDHCKELGLPVQGAVLLSKFQEEIFSNLKILFEQKQIELPDDLDLISSLNCITVSRNRIGGYMFDHPAGSHDDLAYALALAVWRAGKGEPIIIKMER